MEGLELGVGEEVVDEVWSPAMMVESKSTSVARYQEWSAGHIAFGVGHGTGLTRDTSN